MKLVADLNENQRKNLIRQLENYEIKYKDMGCTVIINDSDLQCLLYRKYGIYRINISDKSGWTLLEIPINIFENIHELY